MLTIIQKNLIGLGAAIFIALAAGPASAQENGWDMALTGGFVASGLADPVWALGTATGLPTRVVLRQRDQENEATLGAAMFVQVHNGHLSWVAPLSFGLGLRDNGRAVFYFGSALRMGTHASFTAGMAVGPIAALPAGVVEGRAVADTNALSNLVTRTSHSWFAGVTYTFASLR
jgi:hypothetical protein